MYSRYILLLTLLGLGNQADADTLTLKNGDKLTGTVVKKETDKIIFKTSYAGDISISWSEVASLDTEQPVELVLTDQTSMKATIHSTQAGTVTLKPESMPAPVTVALDKVQYVNPSPVVTGKGIKISGRANAGFAVSNGNTDNNSYNLDAEVVLRSKINRFTVGTTLYKASEDNMDTADESTLYLKYDHFLNKKQYLYGNTSFARDKFKDRKLKSTIGLGYGHQFWESDQRNLSLEGGLTYVNEDFYVAADDNYAAARWALKFDQKMFDNRIQFFHLHEGLVGLEDRNNVSITSQTGFRFPIYAGMNASIQMNIDWDKSPAPGFVKTDRKYLFNLGYAW